MQQQTNAPVDTRTSNDTATRNLRRITAVVSVPTAKVIRDLARLERKTRSAIAAEVLEERFGPKHETAA